jgi:hypothetical protein
MRRMLKHNASVWLALLFLGACAQASATVVNFTVAPPTQNTDDSTIPASGPGSLTGFRVEWGTCAGSAFGTRIADIVMPAVTGSADLAPGAYCFRAYARNTFGQESAASPVVARTVTAPIPRAPTITVTLAP